MRNNFRKAEIRCAFWEFWPKDRFFAADFGENDAQREETINTMWRKFTEILLSVVETD